MTTPAPALSHLTTITVEVGAPIEVGSTAEGHRRIIPILGGRMEGPVLNGRVLAGGADFQTLRSETVTHLEARYAVETDDGARIFIDNFGIRSGSAPDIARLVAGEHVDPGRIYFRSSPRFSAGAAEWAWLDERIMVATGERTPTEVLLTIFVVE